MKRIINGILALSALLIFSQNVLAQQDRNDEIIKSVSDYFFLERENIHAHFDKNVFTTDESVWFKGYVFHRKKNVPFFTTVNIYASLINSDGQTLQTKLLYGNIGSFAGNFKLGNLKSGKYYIQFYTNWMNNFTEDESAVYEITVVNPETGPYNISHKPDPASIIIDINPEGGTLLNGTANTVGLHIADCNNNPLPITFAEITDITGKLIQKVAVNAFGYGRFDFPATATQGYKAVVTVNNVKHEKAFPPSALRGIALEVNSYAMTGKTIFKVHTNKNSFDSFNGKPLYLLVHQDNKALVLNIDLESKSLEQTLVIANTDLADGLNTVRILDSNLNPLAERIFFNYYENNLKADLQKEALSDGSLSYKGNISYPNMNVSIAVLPESVIGFDDTNDIYASFMVLPYISTKDKISGRYYFNLPSKNKMYELDLLLLNKKSKYNWNNIMHNIPKSNYTFDMGLTVKGTIPANVDTKSAKIRMYSLTAGIDVTAAINDKKQFTIDNIVFTDSTYVNFELLKDGKKPKQLTLLPQVVNRNKQFSKPYIPQHYKYYSGNTEIATKAYDSTVFSRRNKELKEIVIEGSRLKYANIDGNKGFYAYKIADMKPYLYQNVLRFIDNYGGFYSIEDPQQGIQIRAGRKKTVYNPIYTKDDTKADNPGTSSVVFLNGEELLNLEILSSIEVSQVDEIYMFDSAKLRGHLGIIRIYLKKGVNPYHKNTVGIVLRNGFEKAVLPFEDNTNPDDFENSGVVSWQPVIMTNERGEFTFSAPKAYDKKTKVLIEGFSADGKLISEIKIL